MTQCWLVKTEPGVYSMADLKRDGSTGWEGVRNYQARNYMRDGMKAKDRVLVYYSGADSPGVAGIAAVAGAARPDPSQWNVRSEFFDKTSTREAPRWMMVDLAFVRAFPRVLPLEELREQSALKDMVVLRRGNRLSVTPVTAAEFAAVVRMAGQKAHA